VVVRLSGEFGSQPVSPEEFSRQAEADVRRFFSLGIQNFELLSNPNLQNEGWGRSWHDGLEFGRWWLEVFDRLRTACPEAAFGFPGLSPGPAVHGKRAEALGFLDQAQDAVAAADWLGVNCVWNDRESFQSLEGGKLHLEYRLRFPDKLLFITEFYNASSHTRQVDKAAEYLEFYHSLRNTAGVGAAFGYALSAPNGHNTLAWRKEGDVDSEILGGINPGLG
jgi:hypothetical protein